MAKKIEVILRVPRYENPWCASSIITCAQAIAALGACDMRLNMPGHSAQKALNSLSAVRMKQSGDGTKYFQITGTIEAFRLAEKEVMHFDIDHLKRI